MVAPVDSVPEVVVVSDVVVSIVVEAVEVVGSEVVEIVVVSSEMVGVVEDKGIVVVIGVSIVVSVSTSSVVKVVAEGVEKVVAGVVIGSEVVKIVVGVVDGVVGNGSGTTEVGRTNVVGGVNEIDPSFSSVGSTAIERIDVVVGDIGVEGLTLDAKDGVSIREEVAVNSNDVV